MKNTKSQFIGMISLALALSFGNAFAATNNVAVKHQVQTKQIEQIIRQHIALGRLDNKYFHPIIVNKRAGKTSNPFARLSKQASAKLTKAGINVAAIARYKAIYFQGDLRGSQARTIINTQPNVVLVVGQNTKLHNVIYSRGPVFVQGSVKSLGGVISTNLVWYSEKATQELPNFTFYMGMPIVVRGSSAQPIVAAAPQYKLNKIKQDRRYACQNYANRAVKQNADNNKLQCGFTGTRWNNNRGGQYNWCMTVLDPVTLTEDGFREDSLKQCQADKTSPQRAQNRPAIPAQCNDPSKQYGAVKKINHAFRYAKQPTSPVQNGLIRYDYNRDKRQDYVFLEAKGENSRVVICMSQGANYQRHVTDIKINSASGFGSYDYSITQSGADLKVATDYFEHNAGSSASQASYRYQPNTKKFKIIKSDSSTAGIIQDGFEYPMSSPPIHSLF